MQASRKQFICPNEHPKGNVPTWSPDISRAFATRTTLTTANLNQHDLGHNCNHQARAVPHYPKPCSPSEQNSWSSAAFLFTDTAKIQWGLDPP